MAVLDCCMTLKVIPPWQANHIYLFLMLLGGVEGGYYLQILGWIYFLEGEDWNVWNLLRWGTDPAYHYEFILCTYLKRRIFWYPYLKRGAFIHFLSSLPKWVLEGVPYGEGTFNWRLALSLHMSYEHFHADLLGGKIRLLFEMYEEPTCKVLVYKI